MDNEKFPKKNIYIPVRNNPYALIPLNVRVAYTPNGMIESREKHGSITQAAEPVYGPVYDGVPTLGV